MAHIKPFKAVRPPRDKAHLVASRSYISYNKRGLENKLDENPYTFLHIINPEKDVAKWKKLSAKERFKLVRKKYESFVERGFLKKEREESFYIYRQTKAVGASVGIIAGIAVDDYINGHVKVHEHTLTLREEMFKDYLQACDFNAEPVLLTYPDKVEINDIIDHYCSERPEYEFTATSMVKHELWVVSNPTDIKALQLAFLSIEDLYIADGHHRSASSALLTQEIRNTKMQVSGNEIYNYFMCLLVAESKIRILEFNRLVKDLNGLTVEQFLQKIEQYFDIIEQTTVEIKPTEKHQFVLYLNKTFIRIALKPEFLHDENPVDSLDPAIVTKFLLDPILNIKDLRTDKRIGFMGGNHGLKGLVKEVDIGKMKLAICLFPVPVEQLKRVADAGMIMPPKSTYVEPKLRSGLTIFEIESHS